MEQLTQTAENRKRRLLRDRAATAVNDAEDAKDMQTAADRAEQAALSAVEAAVRAETQSEETTRRAQVAVQNRLGRCRS